MLLQSVSCKLICKDSNVVCEEKTCSTKKQFSVTGAEHPADLALVRELPRACRGPGCGQQLLSFHYG